MRNSNGSVIDRNIYIGSPDKEHEEVLAFNLGDKKNLTAHNIAMGTSFNYLVSKVFKGAKTTLSHYSLQKCICIVEVQGGHTFAIGAHLYAIFDKCLLADFIIAWTDAHPIRIDEDRQICFIGEALGFKESFEMDFKIHRLFLDLYACQSSEVYYDMRDDVYLTEVNGTSAIFPVSALANITNLVEAQDRFSHLVEQTQDRVTCGIFVL